MKIVMMSRLFARSGVGYHIIDLTKKLISLGHKVYIVSSTNDHEDFIKSSGAQFKKIDFSLSPVKALKSIFALKEFLRREEIDVVHCHHRICGLYMQLISNTVGVPFLWSNHLDDIPSDLLHRLMTFYGYKTICVSTELKEFCMDKLRIPERDIEVIIHGVDLENYHHDEKYVREFKETHGITNEKIIGLFARMAPMKGHACLIEALSKMPKESLHKTKTVLFGGTDGEYVESLKSLLANHGLSDNVIFEGFVSASQALSLCDITVLPSVKEGFGIVSIESFAMMKPHIRTKTAGYQDLHSGCIGIDVGDSDALCYELTNFANGKDYSDLIASSTRLLYEKCTLECMTQRLLRIYEEAQKKASKD